MSTITTAKVAEVAQHHIRCAQNSLKLTVAGSGILEQSFVNIAEARAARDETIRALAVLELGAGELTENLRAQAHDLRAQADAVAEAEDK